ncbi:hypothetical protein NEOLEDRAFT_1061541 [Neolentinus lepideus HHB14362 ss-1]|uniref:Signal recognition particle subunit SRP72 n=1 Tax=Neolentinus lepideus HHB14362 ss-1 TaxID=1314782 RepID=A0A165TS46_9AGAM|nr:hypothetical protein NEOLEDRAFT_1061541 [Neolentinus lepideus HHB14362 ss-1]
MVPPKQVARSSQGKGSTRKRPTSKPKQPLSVPQRLERLFISLCAQIDGGHFTNAVKTCDKILKLAPDDSDAIQTKLFLLLQTEKYDAALVLIDSNNANGDRAFEKAYSLYRLEREPEAAELLSEIKNKGAVDQRGALHLEAQLAYRQGDYQTACDLYNQLLDTAEPQSDEQADILTNLQASQKHLDFINVEFLHALDRLPSSLTSNLESAPPPSQQVSTSALSNLASISGPAPGEDPAKTRKRVRMKRVPKGVVPGVTPPPDPERWLKKSERSTHTQSKGRKKGGATQGVVADHPPASVGASTTHSSQKGGGRKKKK